MMVMRLAQVTEWCNKSDSGKLIGPLMIGRLPVYDVTEALNRDSTPKVGDMSPLYPPPLFFSDATASIRAEPIMLIISSSALKNFHYAYY